MKAWRSIFIRDYRCELVIGVYPQEHVAAQPLLFNIELWVDAAPVSEDDLSAVLDYDGIVAGIKRVSARPRFALLEAFADQLAAVYFEDLRVNAVRIRIEKTGLVREAAGLGTELYRERAANK